MKIRLKLFVNALLDLTAIVENGECLIRLSSNYGGKSLRDDWPVTLGTCVITILARLHQCNAHQDSGLSDRLGIVHAYPNSCSVVPPLTVLCLHIANFSIC